MSRPFRLSRRSVLRGAGTVAIALPWLEIMTPERRSSAAPTPPSRFLAVYQPGGTIIDHWRPTGTATDFTLSPILAPLEPVKDRIVVLDGLDMASAVGEQNQAGMIAWLTGTPQVLPISAESFSQGPSIDQVIAGRLAAARPLRSLSLAVRWGTGKSHGLVHPIDIVNFADDAAFSPLKPLLDPQAVWKELFGALGPDEAAWDSSILDAVGQRYRSLALRLGASDRMRLEQHLDRIRQLEQGLSSMRVACAAPERVDTTGYDPESGLNSSDDGSIVDLATDAMIPTVGRFMTDMLVMAFACDLTPVGTLQWSDCEAKHTFPWLGLTEHHHYYMNDGGFHPAEIEQIATWYSEQHAYLIAAMAGIDMGGHSLLDESIVFFGSNLQNPATHIKNDMPFLLAGNGGGLQTGRWLSFGDTSHNDLLVSLLNRYGDTRTSFGDPSYCTGPLTEL